MSLEYAVLALVVVGSAPWLMKRPRAGVALIASVLASATPVAAAEHHVVPIIELRQRAESTAKVRQANLTATRQFLAREPVRVALRSAGIDGTRMNQAVALLSDDELARLAARAEKVQADLAAGALSNQELTYIVIALAAAVLVLVVVAA